MYGSVAARMIGQMACKMVASLGGCLVTRSPSRPDVKQASRHAGRQAIRRAGMYAGWLDGWVAGWMIGSPVGLMACWQAIRQAGLHAWILAGRAAINHAGRTVRQTGRQV